MKMKKRHTVLAVLVLFLGLAVLANWYYTNPENKILPTDGSSEVDVSNVNGANLGDIIYANSTDVSDEYFAGAKLSRDESYDEAVATLKEIIESSDIDEQSVKTASDSIKAISERRITQVNIENLVKAKTGSDCVVVITDEAIEVIIKESSLSDQTVLQIKEIVINNTEFSAEKISIIGAK
ncbi:MAG: SpoIIIAH-like family protein [Clostridia bacterium]|nr:SpoIIIAH-like family protein [Clostridia bacterium]